MLENDGHVIFPRKEPGVAVWNGLRYSASHTDRDVSITLAMPQIDGRTLNLFQSKSPRAHIQCGIESRSLASLPKCLKGLGDVSLCEFTAGREFLDSFGKPFYQPVTVVLNSLPES